MKDISTINEITEEVFGLYERFGDEDYIGEPVSQIEHMSQSAQLAMLEGYDDEVILAAFFHDIGHICASHDPSLTMGGFGIKRHEQIGADFLRTRGFPEKVAQLVENHVQAKRYLTFKYPGYYHALSEASKKTLEFQGGKMTEEEADGFENNPLFKQSIRMRQWDEMAKEINVPIVDLNLMKDIVKRVLTKM